MPLTEVQNSSAVQKQTVSLGSIVLVAALTLLIGTIFGGTLYIYFQQQQTATYQKKDIVSKPSPSPSVQTLDSLSTDITEIEDTISTQEEELGE